MLLRRLAIAIGLLCALLGSQLPEFAQQYRQRLGGALDELNRMIAQFDAEASGQSLTRDQGLDHLKTNDDPLARQRREAAVADEVCSVLMGEDVELRRHFIQTNAKDVRFLDI